MPLCLPNSVENFFEVLWDAFASNKSRASPTWFWTCHTTWLGRKGNTMWVSHPLLRETICPVARDSPLPRSGNSSNVGAFDWPVLGVLLLIFNRRIRHWHVVPSHLHFGAGCALSSLLVTCEIIRNLTPKFEMLPCQPCMCLERCRHSKHEFFLLNLKKWSAFCAFSQQLRTFGAFKSAVCKSLENCGNFVSWGDFKPLCS